MKILLQTLILIFSIVTNGWGQYPFEKFPSIKYTEFKDWKTYDRLEAEGRIHFTLTVPRFFDNMDTLTLQLTSYQINWDSSFVRIFRNKKQIQKIFEPMFFSETNVYEPLRVENIDGDSLKDIKLLIPYMGNGLAAMNQRVIYLFQKADGYFNKISFSDKMDSNRPERDFDGDNKFEIITMTLNNYGDHNYWTFNIYNYSNGELKCQNEKFDYPIMVQFLFRENYKVTEKISKERMKMFGAEMPEDYSSN